jgi:hypothetical protein
MGHYREAQPTTRLQLALEMVEEIRGAFSIDARRLYVTGQSLGVFGTWAAELGLQLRASPVCLPQRLQSAVVAMSCKRQNCAQTDMGISRRKRSGRASRAFAPDD